MLIDYSFIECQNYEEHHRSGQASLSPDSGQVTRVFDVDYVNYKMFVIHALGYTIYSINGPLRTVPERHPIWPNFYACDASVEALGSPGLGNTIINAQGGGVATTGYWTRARVTLTYKPLDYFVPDTSIFDFSVAPLNHYCTRLYGYSTDMLTTESKLKYVSGTAERRTIVDDSHVIPIFTTEKVIIWRQIPTALGSTEIPNLAMVKDLEGKVNDRRFDGHEAGTMLFLGVESVPKPQIAHPFAGANSLIYDLHFKFSVIDKGLVSNPHIFPTNNPGMGEDAKAGHNHKYRTDSLEANKFELVTTDGLSMTTTAESVRCKFQAGDFRRLFALFE